MFNYLEQIIGGVTGGDKAVKHFSTVSGVVTAVANIFIVIGFGLTLVSMAFSFIQFATSAGDKDAFDRAKSTLSWAGIGFFIVLGAYLIKNIILGLMGARGRII